MGEELVVKIVVTLAVVGLVSLFMYVVDVVWLKPKRVESKLKKQGIRSTPTPFMLENVGDKLKINQQNQQEQALIHTTSSSLFPFFDKWSKELGSIFMFSFGKAQILYVNKPDVVKEISMCTSLDFGKPSYQQRDRAPLLGQGILTSNGSIWAHQRKILAPQLYMDKVKGMMNSMEESSMKLVNSWNDKIVSEGGVAADIQIDEYMRRFSSEVISRTCFGSNYASGEEIFLKLRPLQAAMFRRAMSKGIRGMQFLPTKNNREVWRLEKEIGSLILDIVKKRRDSKSEKDLLQAALEGAKGSGGLGWQSSIDRFIVDNCKNIYLAGYETTAVSASWTLMLLASEPEWQDRVRAEVLEVCGGQLPDAEMLRKMKTLTMVINESLRLYPPIPVVSREVLRDMKFGDIHVPAGVNLWTVIVTLHQDPEIWGEDAGRFNPARFANGVSGACKLPYTYMPFGFGPRICLGQSFAITELKILLALIVSNFSLTLSPKYKHSPTLRQVIEPEHGVNLVIKRL